MAIDGVGPGPDDAAEPTVPRSAETRVVKVVPEWDPAQRPGPRSDEWSGFAVAAFVFGLLGGLLGVVYGIIALVKIRQTRQRGKGLAIAGLALCGAWALFVGIALFATTHLVNSGAPVRALLVGDCFTGSPSGSNVGVAGVSIKKVPCTQPHNAEFTGEGSLSGGLAEQPDYPGSAVLAEQADQACRQENGNHVLDPLSLPAEAHAAWYLPSKSEWALGDHSIRCFLTTDPSSISRSMCEDASTVNADQLRFLMAIRDFKQAETRLDALRRSASFEQLRTATAEASQAQSDMWLKLKAATWPSAVQPAMSRLVGVAEAASPIWENAAHANSQAELVDLVAQARRGVSRDDELAVRRALGLSTQQGEPLPSS